MLLGECQNILSSNGWPLHSKAKWVDEIQSDDVDPFGESVQAYVEHVRSMAKATIVAFLKQLPSWESELSFDLAESASNSRPFC